MTDLTGIRNNIHTALKEAASAEAALKDAQAEYDKQLLKFEEQHKEMVSRRNKALIRHEEARKALANHRDQAKEALSADFIEELPEGFKQNRKKVVTFDAQGFRKQAMEYFPFLLVLDEKAAEQFFIAMAVEQKDNSLILPENIRSLASVEVTYQAQASISNATIEKLDIETDTEDTSPANNYKTNAMRELSLINAPAEAWASYPIEPESSVDENETTADEAYSLGEEYVSEVINHNNDDSPEAKPIALEEIEF